MPTTTFDPAIHGFRFDNRFVNVVVSLPGVPKFRTKGRCGGLTYAALDYFTLLRAAPTFTPDTAARGSHRMVIRSPTISCAASSTAFTTTARCGS